MKPEIQQGVQMLRAKISAIEEQANELKKVVNGFYADEGEPPPYVITTGEVAVGLGALRSDYFYGHTLAEAAQEYLKMRKAAGLGSASVNDIYKVLKDGGYKFDTAKEEYAKNGVRISLRKNPAIFHQLPNGDYGLCVWYGVKGKNEEPSTVRKRHGKRKKAKAESKPDAKADGPKSVHQSKYPINENSQVGKSKNGEHSQSTTPAQITVQQLEAAVKEKPGRVKDLAARLHTTEEIVQRLLEPASRVYKAEAAWLKIRETKP